MIGGYMPLRFQSYLEYGCDVNKEPTIMPGKF